MVELREALEQSWQRRRALEHELEALREEVAALRAARDEAPAALAAERESLRRQIDDLLTVRMRMADEMRGVLDLIADGAAVTAHVQTTTAGRVHGDLDVLLDGPVLLVAEPLVDFDTIAALERTLATSAQVKDVHVRTADGERAVYDLELRAPGPLLQALDGRLPFDADAQLEGDRLVLRVRSPQ